MDPVTITAVVATLVAVGSLVFQWVQHRWARSDRRGDSFTRQVKAIVEAVIKDLTDKVITPLAEKVQDHTNRFTQSAERLGRIEVSQKEIAADVREVRDTLIEQGVKVNSFWTQFTATMTEVAVNQAKILHQPDPRRAHIDHLLEAFMEGTLTADERLDLRKFLVQIRNYDPGGPSTLEFPVYPGEQTAAAILLSTMDLVDPGKVTAIGHASHRSHGTTTTTTTVRTSQAPGDS